MHADLSSPDLTITFRLTRNMNGITTIIRSGKGGRGLLQEGHANSADHAVGVARFVAREDVEQQCLCLSCCFRSVGLALLLLPRPGGTGVEETRQARRLLRTAAVSPVRRIATVHRCCRGTGSYKTFSRSATTPHSSPVNAARGGSFGDAATAAATNALVLRGSERQLPSKKLRGCCWRGVRWASSARREEEQGGREVASHREVRVGRSPGCPHTLNPLAADRARGNKAQTC